MRKLQQSRLIDFFAESTKRDLTRTGASRARIVAVSPLSVHLVGVDKPVPAVIVGTPPTAQDVGKDALIYEAGAGARYFLGVIHG